MILLIAVCCCGSFVLTVDIISLWDWITIYPFTPLLLALGFFPYFCYCKHSCTYVFVHVGEFLLGQFLGVEFLCHNFRQCCRMFSKVTTPVPIHQPWIQGGFNDFFLWSQFLPNTLLGNVKYNMFKMAISFCVLDHLLWTLSISTDAFILVYFIDVYVATRDFFVSTFTFNLYMSTCFRCVLKIELLFVF